MLPGQFVAATLAIWNPYVAERLLQGHWSLLVGYGCLPWVAATMLRLRTRRPAPLWPEVCALAFWTALAGLTPTGLMLAATVALVCSLAPGAGRPRRLCAALGLGIGASSAALPWLVAAIVAGSLSSSQAEGVAGVRRARRAGPRHPGQPGQPRRHLERARPYPARGQRFSRWWPPWCCWASWRSGLPVVARMPSAVPLLVLAAVAVVVPALMATGPGLAFVEATVRALPGLGVVRDAQKWVALAVPGYTLAAAAAVVTLRRWLPGFATATVCSLGVGGDAARPGVGGRRQGRRGAVPAGLGGGRRGDQRRPAAGGGAARRQHAALSVGRATRRCSTRCRAGSAPTC